MELARKTHHSTFVFEIAFAIWPDDLENAVRQQILWRQSLLSALRLLDSVADDVHHWLHGKPGSVREAAQLVDRDTLEAFGLAERQG